MDLTWLLFMLYDIRDLATSRGDDIKNILDITIKLYQVPTKKTYDSNMSFCCSNYDYLRNTSIMKLAIYS
jgi:hypothetical protein